MNRRELLLGLSAAAGWAVLSRVVRASPETSGPTRLDGIVIAHQFGEAIEFSATFERYYDQLQSRDVYEIVGTNDDGGTMTGTIWAETLDGAMQTLDIKVPLLEQVGKWSV